MEMLNEWDPNLNKVAGVHDRHTGRHRGEVRLGVAGAHVVMRIRAGESPRSLRRRDGAMHQFGCLCYLFPDMLDLNLRGPHTHTHTESHSE